MLNLFGLKGDGWVRGKVALDRVPMEEKETYQAAWPKYGPWPEACK